MTVEFSTDPERIAAFRAETKEPLERFFRELPEMYSIYETDRRLLHKRRAEALPRLLEIAARDMATTIAGAAAILSLCALKEPAVLPIARETLRDAEAPRLHILMNYKAAFLGTDAEIRRMLLAGLDSPDPRRAISAVQECGILGMPGAVERFIELIRRPDAPDRPRLAYWIGKLAPTPANVAAIEAAWLDEPMAEDEDYWFVTALADVVDREGPPEARLAAVSVLLRWLGEIRNGARPHRGSPSTGAVGLALNAPRRAAPGDPRCVAIAADLLCDPNSPFEYVEPPALEVIAAGDRSLRRAIALQMLRAPDLAPARAAARSLGAAYADSGDSEVVSAIRAAKVQHGAVEAFDEALAKFGVEEAVRRSRPGSATILQRAGCASSGELGSSPPKRPWTAWALSARSATPTVWPRPRAEGVGRLCPTTIPSRPTCSWTHCARPGSCSASIPRPARSRRVTTN